jgi:hypothetical protein
MDEAENKPLFVIDDEPVVQWPVIVNLPQAGGTFNEFQFPMTFRVLSPGEYESLMKDATKPDGTDVLAVPKLPSLSEVVLRNVPIFQNLITDWSGVKDRDGNDVTYTPEKLAEQITGPRGPALSAGIWRAISEIRFGIRSQNGLMKDGARTGN